MRGEDEVRQLLSAALHGAPGDEAEVGLLATERGLTRFAGSRIHQNLVYRDAEVFFRIAAGQRVGVARTNDLTAPGLTGARARALAAARASEADPEFPGLPRPGSSRQDAAGACDGEGRAAPPGKRGSRERQRRGGGITGGPGEEGGEAEAAPAGGDEFHPAGRGELAAGLIDAVRAEGLEAAGSVSTMRGELAVANSHGLFAWHPFALMDASVIALDGATSGGEGGSSGYAAFSGSSAADLDPRALAAEAAGKCLAGRQRVEAPQGPLDVLLEPAAVAGLLEWLAYIGFGGRQFNEGVSFLSGRLGEALLGEGVTIYDDQAEVPGLGFPFDFEGVPRRRVLLVERGRAQGVVHDRRTAARSGTLSTGHAGRPDGAWGPLPSNLGLAAGEATSEEMLSRIDQGLVVTRFHYINGFLDTRRALFTGMTRDGTFLVRRGKVVGAVRDLRFTESMLEAFSRVEAVGRGRRVIGTWASAWASCHVPALLVRGFHFGG